MINRRTFLKNASLLTLVGAVSQQACTSGTNKAAESETAAAPQGKKQMGLQTYSLGSDLLQDLPGGLERLAKMGYTELEIFGYKEDTGEFGTYSKENSIFVSAKQYKELADAAGLKITSSHLTPRISEYTPENAGKFDEFWKKAVDIHATLGVTCMVQPSLPKIENEDDAKRVCDIFNRAGEIAQQAGIRWGYHNHSNEFKRVLKAGEKPDPNAKPWEPQGTYIEELFLKNTDPDKVLFELDVYWAVMGQQDPIEWLENYPDRFKLLHIKDRWIIGASGMMNFPNIFKKAYENNILGYYVELEGDRKGRPQFLGVEESAKYLQSASFVR
ncbi:MAG: sugar phosphate isomerase/epimerase family protein [Parabacteroides sp.]